MTENIIKFKDKILIGLLILISLSCIGCRKEDKVTEAIELIEPVNVRHVTVQAAKGDINNYELFTADVVPYIEELKFKRNGEFIKFHVKIGDHVKQGDLLAELDDEPYIEQVEQIEDQISSLIDKYERENKRLNNDIYIKSLYIDEIETALKDLDDEIERKRQERNLINYEADILILKEKIEQNNEVMNLELTRLKKELAEAKNQVGNNLVLAPFDGEIVALANLLKGDRVSEDRSVVGLVDSNKYLISTTYISETDINSSVEYYFYKDNVKYPITYVPYDPQEYASLVLRGDTPMTKFIYDGDVADVNHGDFGFVCLVKSRKEDILTIPINALESDSTGDYVYVLENGIRVRRNVSVGLSDEMSVEIIDGLVEGESIHVEK